MDVRGGRAVGVVGSSDRLYGVYERLWMCRLPHEWDNDIEDSSGRGQMMSWIDSGNSPYEPWSAM